jgi:hypothetical protein
VWAGRREGEDLLAECVSVGICLHLSCGQRSVILWRMKGKRGMCLQICCVGIMGLSLWGDSLRAWFIIGPRPRSQKVAARFLVLGFKMWRVRVVYRGS